MLTGTVLIHIATMYGALYVRAGSRNLLLSMCVSFLILHENCLK